MTVALYCRISRDPTGRTEGVAAQERAGRKYAAAHWSGQPVQVFSDNNISASNGADRPGYTALRAAIRDGQIGHVWTVEQSRLERREAHWFTVAAEMVAAGITELHTDRDGVVPVDEEIAGFKAVLAAAESRRLRGRVNDGLADRAALGQPAGATVFGYRRTRNEEGTKTLEIVDEQAEVIRAAAAKILAGWSLSSIAAELRAAGWHGVHRPKVRDAAGEVVTDASGVPVTHPSTIGPQTVSGMITNPTVAGWRTHRGQRIRGNWDAILDEATWQACRDKLAANRTVRRSDGGSYPVGAAHASPGRKYLLTGGLAVCGVCDHPLVGTIKQFRGRAAKPYLLCHPSKHGEGCVGIMLPEVEEFVVAAMFDELDKPEFLDLIAADDQADRRAALTDALRGTERQREELAALWAIPGELSTAEWQTARQALAEQEQQLRAELAAVPPPLVNVDIATARSAWAHMTLGERREFIRLFVASVTVNKAVPGTKGFDEGRVAIEWKR